MCGIFGMISEKWQNQAESAASLLSHRGPDDYGVFRNHPLSLFHYRLSILDLSSNGHQPMMSEDGRYVIIFNGEIYNHFEIRKQLSHHQFKTSTDTETILAAFANEGISVFKKLNGIFAIAIFDKKENELILVRDQLGVKPIYYHQSESGFVFSSELKSIASLPEFDKSLDVHALLNYIQFMYSPGCNTPFRAVRKLEPGHYMRISFPDAVVLENASYYKIPFSGIYLEEDESYWIEKIDQQLQKTIQRQLLSDVPVGYFISGGLDSSLIAAISKRLNPDKTLTGFTIRNSDITRRDGFADDYPYACKVAKLLDIDLNVVDGKLDLERDLNDMIRRLDEPQTEVSAMYVSNIARMAREKGFIVLLSGMGGDDLFAGYRRHKAVQYDKYLFKTPFTFRKLLAELSSHVPVQSAPLRRLKKFLGKFRENNLQSGLANYYKWIPNDRAFSLFNEDIRNELKGYEGSELLLHSLFEIPDEHDPLNQLLFWDMHYFLPDHNLNYTDKMSMKHGVEVRVPFCDVELVNLSASIPPGLKMKHGMPKYLLKKVAERYLPEEIIYRPKTGFGGPLREWISGDLKAMVDYKLSKEKLEQHSIFEFKEVRKLIEDNLSGKIDASYPILSLIGIQSWMETFLNSGE